MLLWVFTFWSLQYLANSVILHPCQKLLPNTCMYAVSQGAMAIECRGNDKPTLQMLATLSDYESSLRCVAERAFLKTLVRHKLKKIV